MKIYCVDMGGKSSSMIYEDMSPTLACMHYGEPVVCYAEKRFFEWHEDEVSVSLRNHSGSYGGGSEVFIVRKSAEASPTMTTRGLIDSMWSKEN